MLEKAKNIPAKTKDPLVELSGSSLYIYLLLLRNKKPLSIRDIQRRLGFKSPNSVRHHLERLQSLGYIRRTRHGYKAIKPKNSLFDLVYDFKGYIIPRQVFTLLASLLLLIGYVIVYHNSLNYYVLFSMITIIALFTRDLLILYNRIKKIIIEK